MKEIIELAPLSAQATAWGLGFAFVCLLPGLLIAWLTLSSPQTAMVLDDDSLRVRGFMFGATFSYQDMVLSDARLVDHKNDDGLRRVIRHNNGFSFPGYEKGWFELANETRAYVALGAGAEALYIPLSKNRALMLDVENPQEVLAKIKAQAGSTS